MKTNNSRKNIVKISIITGVVALLAVIIGGITILIGNNKIDKLKGASSNTFRIVYNSNGGKGSMKEQYVEHGKTSKLSKNAFTKNGKEFTGWIAKRIVNGKELFRGCKTNGQCTNNKASWMSNSIIKSYYIYKDGQEVKQTGKAGETVYMYAQWSGEKNGVVSSNTNSNNTNSVNQTTTSKKTSGEFLNSLFSVISKTIDFFSKITIKKPVIITPSSKVEETSTTTVPSYANSNIIETKKINKNVCSFPFGSINCEKQTNASVKKIQEMLKTLGFYNGSINGKYNVETREAVEKFQISENIGVNKNGEADGIVGYKELLALVKNEKIKAPYFIVKYEKVKNGVDTTIYGTSIIKENGANSIYQVILKGIGDKIPQTQFKHKKGASHVGYYAQREVSGTTYHYGCDSTECNSGSWKASKGSNFNYYIYEIGKQNLVETGENGETVIMTAAYCEAMYNSWDKNKSKCTIDNKKYISGVATGYLSSPFGLDDDSDYSGIASSKYFPKRSSNNNDAHGALDFPKSIGTPIYAMDGGTVRVHSNYAYNCLNNNSICNSGYNAFGISIEIDHENGYRTRYAHLSSLVVSSGKVKKGELIGYSGNTGRSGGAHLHLELINSKLYNSNNGDSNREYVKSKTGRGLMNSALYINKNITYVGQNK